MRRKDKIISSPRKGSGFHLRFVSSQTWWWFFKFGPPPEYTMYTHHLLWRQNHWTARLVDFQYWLLFSYPFCCGILSTPSLQYLQIPKMEIGYGKNSGPYEGYTLFWNPFTKWRWNCGPRSSLLEPLALRSFSLPTQHKLETRWGNLGITRLVLQVQNFE